MTLEKDLRALQIFINRGFQPREKKRILEDTNFLQDKLFKQGSSLSLSLSLSSSKEALSLSKEALSKVLKPPSSTLEVYKERSSVGSTLNAS
jgi:hypothetical protein